MAEGPARWAAARARLTELITSGDVPAGAVRPVRAVELRLPFEVADYVDFYASEHHASNLGRLLRPNTEPLMPNWKHLPVGYHGRAGHGRRLRNRHRPPAPGSARAPPTRRPCSARRSGSTSRRNSGS